MPKKCRRNISTFPLLNTRHIFHAYQFIFYTLRTDAVTKTIGQKYTQRRENVLLSSLSMESFDWRLQEDFCIRILPPFYDFFQPKVDSKFDGLSYPPTKKTLFIQFLA